MIKRIDLFKKQMPFLAIMLLSALVSYDFIQMPLHEVGHYTFAYAFNSTGIANLSYPIKENLMNPFAAVNPAVNYKVPMIQSFSVAQIGVISFAGFLFEIFYWLLLILLLDKILLKRMKSVKSSYITSIFFGFYISSMFMLYGWFGITNINSDVYKVILSFPNTYEGLIFTLAVEFGIAIAYIKFLIKFSKEFFFRLKRL